MRWPPRERRPASGDGEPTGRTCPFARACASRRAGTPGAGDRPPPAAWGRVRAPLGGPGRRGDAVGDARNKKPWAFRGASSHSQPLCDLSPGTSFRRHQPPPRVRTPKDLRLPRAVPCRRRPQVPRPMPRREREGREVSRLPKPPGSGAPAASVMADAEWNAS